jgi:predicted MFS family arabinose efflux permease
VLSPTAGALAGRMGSRRLLAGGSVVVGLGFLVLLFERADSPYWVVIFPALLLVAVGMSAVAAPLTTAVLTAAGPGSSGAASGLNSAVSRIGGTFAVALLGGILGSAGVQLLGAFHFAAGVAAVACFAAAAIAVWLVEDTRERPASVAKR